MSRDEFKAYDLLRIHAGNALGLGVPTMAQAAELADKELAAFAKVVDRDPKGRAAFEELAAAFDYRLLGRESVDDLTEWFNAEYGSGLPKPILTRTSLWRVRTEKRASTETIERCSKQAGAFLAAMKGQDAQTVFGASTELAGQYIFQLLLDLNGDPDKRTDSERGAKIIGALAKLQQAKATTDLLAAKLIEMERKFDEAAAAAQRAADGAGGDGKFTPEVIAKIRAAMFGQAA